MGMYDSLYINNTLLPLTEEQKAIMPDNPGWQTKDFDCALTELYITDEGELKVSRWIDGEDDEGVFIREDERLETIEHHGYIRFYSTIDRVWFEFRAKFTDGKLVNIQPITPKTP